MKTIIKTAGVAIALAASASGAMAGSQHEASGRVERVNPRGMHLTVNHRVYRYNPRLVGAALKRGEFVRIWYTANHGHRVATKIVPKSA